MGVVTIPTATPKSKLASQEKVFAVGDFTQALTFVPEITSALSSPLNLNRVNLPGAINAGPVLTKAAQAKL